MQFKKRVKQLRKSAVKSSVMSDVSDVIRDKSIRNSSLLSAKSSVVDDVPYPRKETGEWGAGEDASLPST